jgi:hypothetical protein
MQKEMRKINKKAAVELSISTIVIVVLAMAMLILGLVLVKNIFSGVNYNVDQVNEKVKDEIGKLFTEDKRVVVYAPSNDKVTIKQGEDFGLAFCIKNQLAEQNFKWKVSLDDARVGQKCGGVTQAQASNWIITGDSGSKVISSGKVECDTVRFKIPDNQVKDIANCIVRFKIEVTKADNSAYQTSSFDVQAS